MFWVTNRKKVNGKGFGDGNRAGGGFRVAWSKRYCTVIVPKRSNGMTPRQERGGSSKGLSRLPKFVSYGFQLAGYGGKLAFLWAELVSNGGDKEKLVWCAVIALERCESGATIWGKVEWCHVVCTVHKTYQLEYALDAIV